ncbi:Hypothetical predicted protein, partial [Mytilus galloprovincialis]
MDNLYRDENMHGIEKKTYWEIYGMKCFPYKGKRKYSPCINQMFDGGIVLKNDVFGLSIRQFEREFKHCLERRRKNEQTIINIRFPVKTSNEYIEYLETFNGGVSQAILKKGGSELSKLLSVPAAKKEMRNEGVATTIAGRNFSCDFIIHINMEDSHVDLKAKFKTVLEKVDELDKKSVALPALGAGISYSVDKVAEYLFEALVSFQRKTFDISEVHVVIYEKDKLSQFLAAMQNCIQSQSNQSQGLFSKFKGMFGY